MTRQQTIAQLEQIRRDLSWLEHGSEAHIEAVNYAWDITEKHVDIEDIRNAKYTDNEFIDEYIRRLA